MSNLLPQYATRTFTEIYESVNDFIYDYNNIGLPRTIDVSLCMTLYYLLYGKYGNSPIANNDETQFKYKMFSLIWQYGPTWEKRLNIQEELRNLSLEDLITDTQIHELFEHEGSNTESGSNSSTASRDTSESGTNTGTITNRKQGTVTTDHDSTVTTDNTNESVKNHANNPETAPATNAYTPLNYIDDQVAQKDVLDGEQVVDETNETTEDTTNTQTNNLADSKTGSVEEETSGTNSQQGSTTASNELTRTINSGKLKGFEMLMKLLEKDVTAEFLSKFSICFKQFVQPGTFIFVTEEDEDDV